MSADHWIYGHARHALRGIPTQDLRCDAEDAAHDCIVNVLEKKDAEDPVAFAAGSMHQFVRWESMRSGRANHRRHYGIVHLRNGDTLRGIEFKPDLDACETHDLAEWFDACAVVGRACRCWAQPVRYEIRPGEWRERERQQWAPWAWLLKTGHDWTLKRLGDALGCSAQNVRQVLVRFEEVLHGR